MRHYYETLTFFRIKLGKEPRLSKGYEVVQTTNE